MYKAICCRCRIESGVVNNNRIVPKGWVKFTIAGTDLTRFSSIERVLCKECTDKLKLDFNPTIDEVSELFNKLIDLVLEEVENRL